MNTLNTRHSITRHLFFLLLTIIVLSFIHGREVNAGSTAGTKAKYLVLISIDSCRPDYLDLVPTPNINKLK